MAAFDTLTSALATSSKQHFAQKPPEMNALKTTHFVTNDITEAANFSSSSTFNFKMCGFNTFIILFYLFSIFRENSGSSWTIEQSSWGISWACPYNPQRRDQTSKWIQLPTPNYLTETIQNTLSHCTRPLCINQNPMVLVFIPSKTDLRWAKNPLNSSTTKNQIKSNPTKLI